jgi:hypothetical protein
MIQTQRSSEHIDPCKLNFFIDGELHVREQERIRQHVKRCRLCALYVVSGKELKAAVARAGLRFAPYATGTAKANRVRKGNLEYINSLPTLRAALSQLQLTLCEVLLLCDAEKLSYRDIALILGIPISTVISRISDARDALCQLLILEVRKSQ